MQVSITSKGGRGRGYRRNSFNEINVTPMVDVMLVLLVIFMITAPMLTAGVTVDLPESAAAPVQGDDEPLTVTIDGKGAVYIQETVIDFSQFRSKLIAVVGENREKRIFVRGDANADYGSIMRVVGEINAAGLTKVALITQGLGSKEASRRN